MVNVGQATGIRLGTVIQNLSSIVTGIVIAFIYSWEFALFILGLSPFFIAAGFLEMKMMAGFSGTEALEGAGQVSSLLHLAIFSCMNTVASVQYCIFIYISTSVLSNLAVLFSLVSCFKFLTFDDVFTYEVHTVVKKLNVIGKKHHFTRLQCLDLFVFMFVYFEFIF